MSVDHEPQAPEALTEIRHFSSHAATPEMATAMFRAARGECPVAHSDELDGFFLLLGYDEVREGATRHDLFSSEPQVLRPLLERPSLAALEMDPPRHPHWRAVFNQAVTPHVLSVLEPLIRADVARHIDSFIERGHADLVKELAEPIPAEVICRLVGIDDALVPEVRDRATAMFAAQGDQQEFGMRLAAFAEITVGEVRRRQQDPRDDYLTYLSAAEVEGRPLDDNDYVAILTGFLGAGHHTTTSAMSSLINEVFGDEAVREQVVSDPARMIPIAVEETLRLRPPFFGFFRQTTRDTAICGVDIPESSDVYLSWASANRDPAVFAEPDEFRLDRRRNRHLTFGVGIHTCPGAALARLELRLVLEALVERTPDLTVEMSEPNYAFSGGDYAFLPTLPVRFTRGERTIS